MRIEIVEAQAFNQRELEQNPIWKEFQIVCKLQARNASILEVNISHTSNTVALCPFKGFYQIKHVKDENLESLREYKWNTIETVVRVFSNVS